MTRKKLILVIFVISFIFAYWYFWGASSVTSKNPQAFTITKGENLENVAQNLEEKNIIRSSAGFRFAARLKGADRDIQPGTYSLSASMSISKILNVLTDNEFTRVKVTIPEGFSVYDIDERLTEMNLITPGIFIATAKAHEGYLFPDTYFVYKEKFVPETLIEQMRDVFDKKVTVEFERRADKKRTLSEIITMASILEKEVKTNEDYAIVSGILWKRLEADWALQTDATLLYGKNSSVITQKELNEESPYNTRKYKGLPPTPIGNPGIATIRGALNPKASPYWFYLTDEKGIVHYAVTNEQHNENKRKYL